MGQGSTSALAPGQTPRVLIQTAIREPGHFARRTQPGVPTTDQAAIAHPLLPAIIIPMLTPLPRSSYPAHQHQWQPFDNIPAHQPPPTPPHSAQVPRSSKAQTPFTTTKLPTSPSTSPQVPPAPFPQSMTTRGAPPPQPSQPTYLRLPTSPRHPFCPRKLETSPPKIFQSSADTAASSLRTAMANRRRRTSTMAGASSDRWIVAD